MSKPDIWGVLSPAVLATGNLLGEIYNSLLAPILTWLVGTAGPAMGHMIAATWGIYSTVMMGVGQLLKGVWDLGMGLASWIVAAGGIVSRVGAGLIDLAALLVRAWSYTFGFLWNNIMQPIVGWVWSALKPAFEWIGTAVGWLLEKGRQAAQLAGQRH